MKYYTNGRGHPKECKYKLQFPVIRVTRHIILCKIVVKVSEHFILIPRLLLPWTSNKEFVDHTLSSAILEHENLFIIPASLHLLFPLSKCLCLHLFKVLSLSSVLFSFSALCLGVVY